MFMLATRRDATLENFNPPLRSLTRQVEIRQKYEITLFKQLPYRDFLQRKTTLLETTYFQLNIRMILNNTWILNSASKGQTKTIGIEVFNLAQPARFLLPQNYVFRTRSAFF